LNSSKELVELLGMFRDELWPVLLGLLDVLIEAFVECLYNLRIEVQIEFAIANLPGADIDRKERIESGSIGTEAAVLRRVFRRRLFEGLLIRLG